jgi:hypothetical protein
MALKGLSGLELAGLSAADDGFYFHFASKEDLVREAMNETLDQSSARYVTDCRNCSASGFNPRGVYG